MRGRPFDGSTPGPGRRKGTPNKATVEVKEACRLLVDDPMYVTGLRKRLLAGKLPPAVECMLWHYAKGKPKEQAEINGTFTLRWMSSEDTPE
jgi:hypothetical protein